MLSRTPMFDVQRWQVALDSSDFSLTQQLFSEWELLLLGRSRRQGIAVNSLP